MNAGRWQAQRERGNRVFLAVLTWTALHLGRGAARWLMAPITFYFYLTGRKARLASRRYLARIRRRRPRAGEVLKHMYTFAVVSVDRLLLLAGRHRGLAVTLHGEQVPLELKRRGRGCLLFVSHVGSFDVMRVPAVRDYSLPVMVLMDRDHNSMAMRLIERLDPALADMIIDARRPAAELVLKLDDYVKQGYMIGVMVDRLRRDEEGINCRFLGADAVLPASPWRLALALQVPVVLCFGLYEGGGRYSVHFELAAERLSAPRSQRQALIETEAQGYCRRLEHYLQRYPLNWFNFYNFWDE